ncbi:TonB-dependent receptor [Sphingorhabdus sp. M41]|uniref:TonB-dependent receptor n=1 Tax=Sphingorhabdus sp. M41 TaxID=1806885 RepID=UPI00078D9E48|nr:TonB-dependent receptor [Sphingorhabdus sp. M41]AMO72577.1 hypothetical protein AZE99_12605 [Sphingorhabdus sp. M41]
MRKHYILKLFASTATIMVGVQPAIAQSEESATVETDEASQQPAYAEIVVTARKRVENILDTPIAISAFDSEALESRGITSVADLADYTPGMNTNSVSSGRNDRSFQSIIIRGFAPALSTQQTSSIFIDGVPVSTPTAIQNIGDPARIEVLKGPQSAYFGRQTFAGAVNVVTQDAPDYFSGTIKAMLGTRENREISAQIGGPLIEDLLSFTGGARYWSRKGSYENGGQRGQTLGDQSTTSANLALEFTPSSNFKAKVVGIWSENDDGPNASGLIPAYTLTDAAGNTVIQSQSNCLIDGNPYFCGALPGLQAGQPSMNVTNSPFIQDFLANPTGRLLDPEDGTDGFGLKSRFYHVHLAMDLELGDTGVTLSSLTGYNDEIKSQLSDLKVYSTDTLLNPFGGPTYFSYPYLVEYQQKDFSQEVRANYDNGGPFHAVVGASYLYSFFQSGGGGSPGNLGVTTFPTVSGATKSRTYGAFIGLTYDVTDRLSLSFDGRYQIDKLGAYARPGGQTLLSDAFAPAGTYADGEKLIGKTYKNFMPRAIINYDIAPDMMAYASYAKGINPGSFNVVFLSRPASTQAAAAAAGLQIAVEPETLDNFEIGLKGRAFNGALTYTLAAYYGIWDKQLNVQQIQATNPNTGIIELISANVNGGKVKVKGIEAELTAFVSDNLTLTASGSINDSSIDSYSSPTVTNLTGITDFSGKENPNTSKYSGVFSAEYKQPVGTGSTEAFVRGDFIYRSGIYTNVSNITKTPAYKQVNARVGLVNDDISIEAYVTNLFNDDAYPSAVDFFTIDPSFAYFGTQSGAVVALRELRTFGIRAKYNF